MPRSVQEWVGKTHDSKVPPRVQLRIWRRQCGDANFAICPLSAQPMRADDKRALHHLKALILGGEHRESNMVWVLASANAEEAKSEVAIKAKNDDRAKKHLGIAGKPTQLSGRTRKEIDRDKEIRSKARGSRTPVVAQPGYFGSFRIKEAGR